MAAPVSPPPATVNASPPVMARATARVPPAYGSRSNTPIGPFQKIVLASPRAAANRAAVCGPMSRAIWSAGIAPAATTSPGAPGPAATITSDGSSIWSGAARLRQSAAASTWLASSSEVPVLPPWATRKGKAMAPPTRIRSATAIRLPNASNLSATLAPPSTTT